MAALAADYLVLWASQTGNAEWIAKNIHTEATKKGYTGSCFVMDDFALVSKVLFFTQTKILSVFLLVGTTPKSRNCYSCFFQYR